MDNSAAALSTIISYRPGWRVSLAGELDASSRHGLYSLAQTLANSASGPVDFDLSDVTFIDSSGWAGVRAAADLLTKAGTSARIVNPSPAVKHLTDALSRTREPPTFVPAA